MFPSWPTRLSCRARFPASTRRTPSEFVSGVRVLPPSILRTVLYGAGYLGGDDPARSIARNEPCPYSVGFLPLGPRQRKELHVIYPSVLHRRFRRLQPALAKIVWFRVSVPWLGAEVPRSSRPNPYPREMQAGARILPRRPRCSAANDRFPCATAACAA